MTDMLVRALAFLKTCIQGMRKLITLEDGS